MFTPSPQQQAVFDWIKTGRGSAFVQAVAGSGKTTTLVNALGLTTGSVFFAAYNKKIAREIENRVAPMGFGNRVRVGTFHSFGFNAWRRAHPNVKAGPDAADTKTRLMHQAVGTSEHLEACVNKLVSLAKQGGAGLFWQISNDAEWYKIVDHHDLTGDLEDPADIADAIETAQHALAWSCNAAADYIDFDDMIYMPIVTKVRMWENDWGFIDEAQDTNPARRALARRMLRANGRAVFVGDVHQAIYGFTGADADAVDVIVREFKCVDLPLTTTYRCPKKVVAYAQHFVPHIQAHASAPEGVVTRIGNPKDAWSLLDAGMVPGEDAILCRNTRPLVSLAFQLIRKGVPAHVEGRDIGRGLIALATRWKGNDVNKLRERLEAYLERETAKFNAKGQELKAQAVADRVETLFVIMQGCADINAVVDKIRGLFQDSDDGRMAPTVCLSTVHKAKGREWPRVFILGRDDYMPSPYARQAWQQEQENNLIYVAATRAQEQLVLLPKMDTA